jgi:hypothetical protein
MKRPIRPVPVPSPIEQAIDRVEARVEQPVDYRVDLPVFPDPIVVKAEDGLRFGVPPGADGPTMLLLETESMCWRPIVLPPDTVWQISRVEPVPPKPALWVPGGKVQ